MNSRSPASALPPSRTTWRRSICCCRHGSAPRHGWTARSPIRARTGTHRERSAVAASRAHARRYFLHAGLVFADLLAALAEAGTGDDDGLLSRIAGLQSLARDGRLPPGEVAPALRAGAAALGRGDDAEAAQILEPALSDLARIGGSHAQREIFEYSLIVAYMRSGQSAKAAPLLRSRLGRRPSARDKAWLALCIGNGKEE